MVQLYYLFKYIVLLLYKILQVFKMCPICFKIKNWKFLKAPHYWLFS